MAIRDSVIDAPESTQTVNTMIAEFEAATDLLAAAKAHADETWGEHPQYGKEDFVAKEEFLREATQRHADITRRLSASGNLPVGTYVQFLSKEGWGGTDRDFGVITKVTDSSYVITKDGVSGKTARLDRLAAHVWMSSYGGTQGARSLSVLRTPAQHRVEAARVATENARLHAEREARWALEAAVRAQREALSAQHGILRDAHNAAVEALIQAHQAEFDMALRAALNVLAKAAPGREETAPPVAPETT